MVDLYKKLDLDYGVSKRMILKKFREYSIKYHPKFDYSSGARQRFIDINVAYYILENDSFRIDYDKLYRKRILLEDVVINETEIENKINQWISDAKREANEYLNLNYKEFKRKVPKKQYGFLAIFEAILEIFNGV